MNIEQVKVIFQECDAGWIFFSVAAGSQSVDCRASEVFDPFPKLVAWLEAIAGGTQASSFIVDEEGREKEFKALGGHGGSLRLRIEDRDTHNVLLEAVVDRRQCVGEFYHTLRAFAESPAYVPAQWECETLGERIQQHTGQTEEELVQKCCALSAEELREYLFKAAPRYKVIWPEETTPQEKSNNFVDRALPPTTTEYPPGVREIPSYYEFPEGFDHLLVDRRRESIRDCLNDWVRSYGGCRLRALVSAQLERWLASK